MTPFLVSRTGLLVLVGTIGVAVGFAADGRLRLVGVLGFVLVVTGLLRRGDAAGADANRIGSDVAGVRSDVAGVRSDVAGLERRLGAVSRRSDWFGGGAPTARRRALDADELVELLDYWNPRLGTSCLPPEATATLHRARAVEDLAVGRLAAPAGALLARLLVAEAAAGDPVEVCEIGTLFGLGALLIHDHLAGRARRVSLTLIDPLTGYYGGDRRDPPTGLAVDRRNLERNARLLGIDPGQLRVIERLSTDPAARAEAGDRHYGLLVIDGDHSWDGIRRDFEDYAEVVAPGGFLLVDDYGAPEWPDVTRYTDEVIAADTRFVAVGARSRTAIYRRRS